MTLSEDDYAELSPGEARRIVAEKLRDRFPDSDIQEGTLAVTIRYSDGHEVQVLPAYRTGEGIRISEGEGDYWSDVIRPKGFARKLQQVNQDNNRGVVPTIKLAKAIQENRLPKRHRLKGYHIESIAIEAFRNYDGPYTRREMVRHFFEHAEKQVKAPIFDSTGQSLHVDDYLGPGDSPDRQAASVHLGRIARAMRVAEKQADVSTWEALLGT